MLNDLDQGSHSKVWEVNGILFNHGVAIIFNMLDNGVEVRVPETWVHPSYWLTTRQSLLSLVTVREGHIC